ncbi:IS630 family transposase [candidate division WWE3 bacterium CG08_land_8_20_14_0_20_41_10]|uniref:IS630 family transposase n=1 Tax=candidate division WWE3 bacterium CG08_land_8_20_14_0_20_41_10 TaxID=1975085 RepID=A0A2H0XBD8_UNCKA|nr:MAG: IS630 family transposase [candidate division WWE3 bacterium CG08_land_8_20_14_0_20_41_10]
MPNFLSMQQVEELKQKHRVIKDKRLADRIKVILSLNAGYEFSQIAIILLLDEGTLRRYYTNYQNSGVDGLLELHYIGGQSNLSADQEEKLKLYLEENTKRTAKEVLSYIAETFNTTYTVVGATKLLHRLGFTYKKPKIVPGKADKAKQDAFIQTYKNIRKHLGASDQLYFLDSSHPEHNTKPSYGWILKGKAHDKIVKTNTGRERLNLNGALNFMDKTAVVLNEERIDHKAVLKLLRKLEAKHSKGKVYMILDNARYYHAKEVSAWVKKHRRFKLVFLPAYSPNLNVIERLWKFFHQQVTWNRYFETFAEFKKETLRFFRHLEKHRSELDTLLTDNFQVVPAFSTQT